MSNWHDIIDESVEESPSDAIATYRERFGGEAGKTSCRSNEVEDAKKVYRWRTFELPLVHLIKRMTFRAGY